MDITLAIVALLMFAAMVVAWAVLPGSTAVIPVQTATDPLTGTAVGHTVS